MHEVLLTDQTDAPAIAVVANAAEVADTIASSCDRLADTITCVGEWWGCIIAFFVVLVAARYVA